MSSTVDSLELPPLVATAAEQSQVPARSRLAAFYELTKPRMNFLVVATTLFGFRIATHGPMDWPLLISTALGTFLTASGAGVLNQLIERQYDAQMRRTRRRPLVTAQVSPAEALTFGALLATCGIAYLACLVNPLTALLGFITLAWYLLLYTPSKRVTTLNTVIGAVPGAIPPMMGVTAAQGAISPTAIALFAILFLWQMPHFLAIAILYKDDYRDGGFRMLPGEDPSFRVTGQQIILYTLALLPATLMPTLLGAAGTTYGLIAIVFGLVFLGFSVRCATHTTRSNARRLFFTSIIYLPLLMAVMTLDRP